jgi:hypothetical protein
MEFPDTAASLMTPVTHLECWQEPFFESSSVAMVLVGLALTGKAR